MVVGADPNAEALKFLTTVQGGSLAKTVKHFGSNVCRCPHKGGWGSYLIYASGQEPNLAFITGHPFQMGKLELFRMQNDVQALLPWQKPEDTVVDVPVTFDPQKYQPYFLPLKMAYGKPMTQYEFGEFLADPDKDAWKGLTLRLRPGLQPGAIAPPAEPLPPDAQDEFEQLKNVNGKEVAAENKQDTDSTEEAVKATLGAEKVAYFYPKDPGVVTDPVGAPVALAEIEKQLPKLKSAIVRLHVVRRGAVNDWTIYHFGIMEPVLIYPDGHEVALKHYLRPSAQAAEKAVRELRSVPEGK